MCFERSKPERLCSCLLHAMKVAVSYAASYTNAAALVAGTLFQHSVSLINSFSCSQHRVSIFIQYTKGKAYAVRRVAETSDKCGVLFPRFLEPFHFDAVNLDHMSVDRNSLHDVLQTCWEMNLS